MKKIIPIQKIQMEKINELVNLYIINRQNYDKVNRQIKANLTGLGMKMRAFLRVANLRRLRK